MFNKTIFFTVILFFGCNDLFQNEQSKESPVWVFVASAERQCITPEYSSLEEAVEQLAENDVQVLNSKELNFVVCEACSCPTGIHYNALIDQKDQSKAFELGWQRVDEGDDTPE